MATFKATIFKNRPRADKTWNVVIRFSHNRQNRYMATTMYVTKKDITASGKIKDGRILDRCNELIKEYRQRVYDLSLETNDLDIDTIVSYIKHKKDNRGISFTEFADKWLIEHADLKGIRNYKTAINALKAFLKSENILCTDINVGKMKDFERSLSEKPRAQSLYTNSIVRIFNDAREYYNDEDNDVIRVRHSLKKYKPAEQNVARKRALDVDIIRRIFELPYSNDNSRGGRRDLALDCFKLSFCLLGMNSADLYNATEIDGNVITYYRTKTKDRRKDNAEIQVEIPVYVMPIVEKYRGKKHVFNFYERYSTMSDLNRAINIGLKEVGKEVGIDSLQFYAARHSVATIAVNDVGISKYIVNDMLNHADQSLKITELYIKKDFSAINKANAELLHYVLD